jgi:DDE superfamily endonuclease/Helix-turn-helix of DDE superfamily endonuclease
VTVLSNPVNYIEKYPERTTSILGISYQQWKELTKSAIAYEQQQQEKLEKSKIRINAPGGGRKPVLSSCEEIGLCLFYLRQMPTFEVLGIQFGISQTQANDTFHKWLQILRKLLPASLLEQLENQPQNRDMLYELLVEIELLVDSTEQDRQRPLNYQEQKKYFSGKQQSHTFKNSVISCSKGEDIIDVTVGAKGPEADINLFRQQQLKFSDSQQFVGDKAYVGASQTITPTKKLKGKELTQEQKQENQQISRQRIFIEHLIRRLKIFRIAADKFRLNPQNYEPVILTICGLVRLRLGTFSLIP